MAEATVDRERVDAATRRIEGVIASLDQWVYKNWQASHSPFAAEQRRLREALDLLDPKVNLA